MDLNQVDRGKRELLEVAALSWPVAVLLAVAVAGSGLMTGASSGRSKAVWAGVLIVCAALTALLGWFRGRKTGGYKRAASRYARLVAGAGQPVVIALGELADSPAGRGADDAHLITLRDRIIETVRVQCGQASNTTTRAAIYEFRGQDDLSRATWAGRGRAPRQQFLVSDVPHGRDVVEFSASVDGRVDRVPNVHQGSPAPRGEVKKEADYASYMSTPISVAGKSWGLLCVDSPDIDNFRETDEGTIALLAGVLAAGLAHAGVLPQKSHPSPSLTKE